MFLISNFYSSFKPNSDQQELEDYNRGLKLVRRSGAGQYADIKRKAQKKFTCAIQTVMRKGCSINAST